MSQVWLENSGAETKKEAFISNHSLNFKYETGGLICYLVQANDRQLNET